MRAPFIMLEHLRHADVLDAAHELAVAGVVFAEVQHAGGRAVDAHLVLDGGDGDVVALPRRAVVVDAALRHDEEREALGAGGRAVDAREHEVHDVVGEIVIARGDEDLRAADRVAAVGQFFAARSCATSPRRCRRGAR
jgi:hypothetical protein